MRKRLLAGTIAALIYLVLSWFGAPPPPDCERYFYPPCVDTVEDSR